MGPMSVKRGRRDETFVDMVGEAFAWLVSDAGLVGPELTDLVIPCATYHGPVVEYRICFDTGDACVETSIRLGNGAPTGWVRLEHVIRSAGYPYRERMRVSAQTRHALRQSLASQSEWARRLHERLAGPDGERLLRPSL